jgi:2'-deoxynucleoside 5'-phosphate N-hydrolase
MKIYFGFTMAGDRGSLAAARRIVALLEALGHEVLTRHLVEEDAYASDRRLTPQQVYERDMAWLAQSDMLIAEVSGSSYGLGYEAGYALGQTGRSVILCYAAAAEERISRMITGCTHPGCTLVRYGSVEELESRLALAASGRSPAG